jgi:hypothetical protein
VTTGLEAVESVESGLIRHVLGCALDYCRDTDCMILNHSAVSGDSAASASYDLALDLGSTDPGLTAVADPNPDADDAVALVVVVPSFVAAFASAESSTIVAVHSSWHWACHCSCVLPSRRAAARRVLNASAVGQGGRVHESHDDHVESDSDIRSPVEIDPWVQLKYYCTRSKKTCGHGGEAVAAACGSCPFDHGENHRHNPAFDS